MTPYTLVRKHQITERIAAFGLAPAQGGVLPDWTAGAHVDVDLGAAGTRSYSLIRWPDRHEETLNIAVQQEPDGTGGSQAMHALKEGANVLLSAPKNSFALRDDALPVALIAGGIGVTPLISMATDLMAQNRDVTFHYAGRSRPVMAYTTELHAILGPRLHLHADDENQIDLAATIAPLSDHNLYICGPKPMIDAARSAAEAAGIPTDQVHVELFTTPEAATADTPFEVELASSNEVLTIPPGKSIIEVLEDAGHDVMYDCQRGDCGICQVDVLEGTPDHRDVVLSDAEKAGGKVMQICVSRAKSTRLVLDI